MARPAPAAHVAAGAGRHGRWLVLAAILLVAVNLRPAVTALTPMLTDVRRDFALGATATGLLGALPEICFAVVGACTPPLARRIGLERIVVVAMVLTLLGQAVRAFAFGAVTLLAVSAVAMAGMAMANVALPPLVKRYFPDRIGTVTGLYTLMLAVGTAVPPLVAVPLAQVYGWRGSAGSWSVLALLALLPWLSLIRGSRVTRPAGGAAAHRPVPVWRSPLAWGLAVFFGMSAFNAYVMFAWLPQLLVAAGVSATFSGAMLSVFAAVGIPASLVVPVLTARLRNPYPVVLFCLACFVVGYSGLLLSPAHLTPLWVIVAGLGPSAFPMSLALVSLRSRTHAGAAQLSGFVQGVGYALGATGPIAFGALHDSSGDYRLPFALLGVSALVLLAAGLRASRPDTVEDELDRRGVRA